MTNDHDAERQAWHDAADRAAAFARNRIYRHLDGIPLDPPHRAFIARIARHGDPDGLAALLAKLRAASDLPIGVTIDRYRVNSNTVPVSHDAYDTGRDVYVERRNADGDGFVIAQGHWSDSPLWNFTTGDWHFPWADDSYEARHYERPASEAIAKARQIVGLP